MKFEKKMEILLFVEFLRTTNYNSELGICFLDKVTDETFWLNTFNKKEIINRILTETQLRVLANYLEYMVEITEEPGLAFEILWQEQQEKKFLMFKSQNLLTKQNQQKENYQPLKQMPPQIVERNQKNEFILDESKILEKIVEATSDHVMNESSILVNQNYESAIIEGDILKELKQEEVVLNIDKCPKYQRETSFTKQLTKFDPELKIYFSEPRILNAYREYFKQMVGVYNLEEWRHANKRHVYLVTKQRQIEQFDADLEYFVEIYDAWNKFSQKKKHVLIACLAHPNADVMKIDDFGVSKIKFCRKNQILPDIISYQQ